MWNCKNTFYAEQLWTTASKRWSRKIMNKIMIVKTFVVSCVFLKSSLTNHSLARTWLLCSKVLLWQLTFLIDWHHKRLKNKIDLLLFCGEHFYGFLESDLWKRWKNHSFHNRHNIWVTDILKFYKGKCIKHSQH